MYMYILGIPGTLPCRLSVNRTVVPTLYICVVVKNVLKKKNNTQIKIISFDDYLTKIYLTKLEQIGKR